MPSSRSRRRSRPENNQRASSSDQQRPKLPADTAEALQRALSGSGTQRFPPISGKGTKRDLPEPQTPTALRPPVTRPESIRRLTYSSLPPTPISASPPPPPPPTAYLENHNDHHQVEHVENDTPFSLWDYLREELLETDFDSHQELKWDRVSNFLQIPIAIEKIIGFGFVLCFDSFLYTFTILPIRFALAFSRLLINAVTRSSKPLPPSQKADLLRMLLLVLSVALLIPMTDASKIYHSIRGQDTIKLYVIFNALEIGDRLCASIGQDIIDCLFSRSNLVVLSHRRRFTVDTMKPFLFFALALLYNVAHTLVMLYQTIALNVAVNSYDHALLTLLVSNQFVEIKGSVFKKFEKDNLFQITCADIVERFTLALMLFVVAFRNFIELVGSHFDFTGGFFLPKSFGHTRANNVLWTISSVSPITQTFTNVLTPDSHQPVLTVLASEMLVDWLKHAFITKFNHIRPSVYERYTDVLCRDLASGSAFGRHGARKHGYVDQSPLVARRLGFASLPLAVLAILIGGQIASLVFVIYSDGSSPHHSLWATVTSVTDGTWEVDELVRYAKWAALGLITWACMLLVKIIMGVNLLSYATRRRAGMEERERADKVNDFGRDPIGEGVEERLYNRELKKLLDDARDDAPALSDMGERAPTGKGAAVGNNGGGDGGKRKRVPLEDITRFTMVKRIW